MVKKPSAIPCAAGVLTSIDKQVATSVSLEFYTCIPAFLRSPNGLSPAVAPLARLTSP
ncbi:hypothetical protein EMIT0324P_30494 [Pseudomonas chlororaphis]